MGSTGFVEGVVKKLKHGCVLFIIFALSSSCLILLLGWRIQTEGELAKVGLTQATVIMGDERSRRERGHCSWCRQEDVSRLRRRGRVRKRM